MINPYRIQGPALVSFSGGRTSGLMLHNILEANNGLPPDVHVTFANTGKEREETLDFVHACSQRWDVIIHWLEYYQPPRHYREVDFETASRHGEPYAVLIQKKQYLPNPVTRFCTIELKIRVMRDFARDLGWEHWTNVVGLRADEMNRVKKIEQNRDRWKNSAPLAMAGISQRDVMDFWRKQSFDLQLQPHEGNCDLCFLKGAGKISAIIEDRPDLAAWWIEQEEQTAQPFRLDRPSYAKMLAGVQAQARFDFGLFDDLESCGSNMCTD